MGGVKMRCLATRASSHSEPALKGYEMIGLLLGKEDRKMETQLFAMEMGCKRVQTTAYVPDL